MSQFAGIAAQDYDAREKQLRELRRKIEALMPNEVSTQQRGVLEEFIAMNQTGL